MRLGPSIEWRRETRIHSGVWSTYQLTITTCLKIVVMIIKHPMTDDHHSYKFSNFSYLYPDSHFARPSPYLFLNNIILKIDDPALSLNLRSRTHLLHPLWHIPNPLPLGLHLRKRSQDAHNLNKPRQRHGINGAQLRNSPLLRHVR